MHTLRLVPAALWILGTLAACGSSGKGTDTFGGTGGSGNGGGGAVGGAPVGGGGGSLIPSTGGTGTSAEAGQCKGTGEMCSSSLDCCDGYCNQTGPAHDWLGCHKRCTQSSECSEGCCLLFSGQTNGFCTKAIWCSCGTSGNACGGTELPACCADQLCVANDNTQTSFACRPRCTQNSDCTTTNCCVPIPQTGVSACLDSKYCP